MILDSTRLEKVIKVRLLDHELQIRSDDERAIRDISNYLNGVIEQLHTKSPVLNRIDLFVMAAFTAARDYIQAQKELDGLRRQVDAEAAALEAIIEQNLAETDREPGT